jgi:hypothetical protein
LTPQIKDFIAHSLAEGPAADALASLEHHYRKPLSMQLPGRIEARHSGSNDRDVDSFHLTLLASMSRANNTVFVSQAS